jgi:hypothetical protein
MLRDLRSVKVRPAERARVDRIRVQFQSHGSVPTADERWLHDVCRRYHDQLEALHEARERAMKTNALRGLGLTREQAQRRAQARQAAEQARSNDLGF